MLLQTILPTEVPFLNQLHAVAKIQARIALYHRMQTEGTRDSQKLLFQIGAERVTKSPARLPQVGKQDRSRKGNDLDGLEASNKPG